MKAMILAAGRGERLKPLTDTTPKPLLEVSGESLIERHIKRLACAGFHDIVVNLAHLGALIEEALGDGARFDVALHYSHEPDGALETAGGIANALPLLGDGRFAIVNADIWTDFDFRQLRAVEYSAFVVLVANPEHHPKGDFSISGTKVSRKQANAYTYSGIGVFEPQYFTALQGLRAALAPTLFELSEKGLLNGTIHAGLWFDIGTIERLQAARSAIDNRET